MDYQKIQPDDPSNRDDDDEDGNDQCGTEAKIHAIIKMCRKEKAFIYYNLTLSYSSA